jgi:hypothetical protein
MGQLTPARRNRYYYGKLMDVEHFAMEQRYVLDQQRQLNRLLLGAGVLSGLRVSVVLSGPAYGLRITPGVALDGLGRLLVVPDEIDLVPLRLTDEWGVPTGGADEPLPANLVVQLCYRECEADIGPVLAPDPCCDGSPADEAGTVIESYAVTVHEGHGDDVSVDCVKDVAELLRQGRVQDALCALVPDTEPAADDEGCVTLANVAVSADGTLTATSCTPRPVVPTNRLLLSLLTCFAQRIEECCGREPPPPQDRFLAIAGVTYVCGAGPAIALKTPQERMRIRQAREPLAFDVEFTHAIIDQSSVVVDSTIVITHNGNPYLGAVSWLADNKMRYSAAGAFPVGDYEVIVRGDPPAIMSVASGGAVAHALDGEAGPVWPTGDGQPGGNFAFAFSIVP